MTHKRIHRSPQTRKKYPSITTTGSSQVNRSYLQRVMENPTEENLTSDVVSELQSTHGNQFVNRLMQRAKQNTNSDGKLTIQRKHAPANKKEKGVRDRAFNARQAGVKLEDAFDGAVDTIDSNVSRPGATWTKWKEQELKDTSFMNIKKKNRINGYANVMELITGGNLDDWVSLNMYSESDYTSENFKFLKAAYTYKNSASDTRFHQVMDTYIYNTADLMINIESTDRNALIERAYRMVEGLIDDNGNENVEDDTVFNETPMSQNPMFGQ